MTWTRELSASARSTIICGNTQPQTLPSKSRRLSLPFSPSGSAHSPSAAKPSLLPNVNILVALASRHGVPAIYTSPEWVKAGGLMSYGTNSADSYRIVGTYAGRILKGERPSDLPIQLATKIVLALNLKSAKTLGLTFPTALLVRADEVIE